MTHVFPALTLTLARPLALRQALPALALLCLLAAPASASGETSSPEPGYLPKGAPEAAGARNIVLIYNGGVGHRNWQTDDFIPLLAFTDSMGTQRARLFDTLLVLMLWADSGRGFCPGFGTGPSNKVDWDAYLYGRIFGGDSHLARLQEAARQVAENSGHPDLRWKVILTIPYPDPTQTDFGPLPPGNLSRDLSSAMDRLAVTRWYMETATALWDAAGFDNLELVGWYWVHEASSGADPAFLPHVAKLVHEQGRKFFWIPWYKAPGSSKWREYGFDAVIHQPNYFFRTSIPLTRLHDAAVYARENGMGVEMELDDRALTDPEFRARYDDYLRAGETEGYRDSALTAWYMGGDTLRKSAVGLDSATRYLYETTYDFISRSGWPGDANDDRYVDVFDALLLLRMAAGRSPAPEKTYRTSLDVTGDGRIDMCDATLVLRHLSGLQPTLP